MTKDEPITLDSLRAAAEAVEALPKPETDITVAPDVECRIRAHAGLGVGVPRGVRVWVDETLRLGTWHEGVPWAERLRREARPK